MTDSTNESAATDAGAPESADESSQTNPAAEHGDASEPNHESGTSVSALADRVEMLEGKVDAIEQAKAEAVATAAAAPPAPKPTPSLGRIVIARYPHRQDAPAVVTFVHSPEVVDLQIFRGDHLLHNGQRVNQIEPSNTDGTGWFWPPRA